ncbi:hypothetical protein Pfo_020474 [Paulownia fortunei]|nr:hypothetical protein Pfo_020474 [Paulownia fortunei]
MAVSLQTKSSDWLFKMEGKLAMTRHFVKDIPPALCKKPKEEKSEWAILRSRKGTWKINVCRNCEGLICFKDGWPQFIHHHGLSSGDFALFEHTGDLHFNVSVCHRNACEKEFLVELKKEQEEAPEAVNRNYHQKNTKREPDKVSVISYHSQNPQFIDVANPVATQAEDAIHVETSRDVQIEPVVPAATQEHLEQPVKKGALADDDGARPAGNAEGDEGAIVVVE